MHYLIHLSLLLLPMLCFCGLGAHAESGIASVYAGLSRTKGELTAAHRTLPIGTRVRVRNRKTGASVLVVVNDRGPFVRGRVIDLSSAAARALGFSGTTFVDVHRAGHHDRM
jgi:rare lipoprotein A